MRDVDVGPTDQAPEAGSGSTKPMDTNLPLTDEEAIEKVQAILDKHFAREEQLPFLKLVVSALSKPPPAQPPRSS